MGKTEVSDIKTDKVAIVYLVLIAVSLFMAYPRVLLYPSGVTHDGHFLNWLSSSKVSLEDIAVPFLVRFPVELMVGALSLFYLASCNFSFRKTPRKLIMSIVLFVLALGGSVMVNGGLPENILGKLNYLFVPLAIALSVVRSGLFSKYREKVLLWGMTILWTVSITWSYWAGSPVGISGNRNWFVSVLLVTSPWTFFFFYHQFRKVLKRFFSHVNENWFASALSLLLTLPITLYWVIKCETRAAWLALIIYGLFVAIYPLSRKAKFLVSGLLLVLAMASFFVFRGTLEKAYNDDIRGPLWANTIRMIVKSPGVGWGPGQFQQKYSMFKSREHSSRLVAALMTEHPHNEFLYLASEVGLPSALIWLSLLVLLILLKVRTREGHLCKFGVIILFVLSMFDKTLISAPGNILFWIFSGVLAARYLNKVLRFEPTPKVWHYSVMAMSVVCFIPVSMRANAIYSAREIHRQTALFETSVKKSKITGQQRKDLYLKVYDGYLRAYDKNPVEIEFPYKALHVAVELLNDTSLAEMPLKECLKINQYYGHVNYLGALYHIKKMAQNRNDEELRKQHLNLAEKHIALETTLYPDNLSSLCHVMELFIKTGNRNSANQIFGMLNDRAVSMFNRKFASEKEVGQKLLEEWIANVESGSKDAVANAQKIIQGFKGTSYLDLLTPRYASSDGFMIEHDHSNFHLSDLSYWREINKFTDFYKKEPNAESMCKKIMDSVEITGGHNFKWPSEVLESGKSNELSAACLMRIATHCQGHLSVLIKVQTLDKVHWLVYVKNEKEEFIAFPGKKKIIHQKIAGFLSESKFIEELIGDKIEKVGLYLFEYPQAFSFRNALLSKIVNRNTGKFPDFCSSPSIVRLNLEYFLGRKFAIEYLKQPFYRQDEDLKQESN